MSLDEPVTLTLSKPACLLLFGLLDATYVSWRKQNPDDATAKPMIIEAKERAERKAFWELESALESTLVELFDPAWRELVQESKRRLS